MKLSGLQDCVGSVGRAPTLHFLRLQRVSAGIAAAPAPVWVGRGFVPGRNGRMPEMSAKHWGFNLHIDNASNPAGGGGSRRLKPRLHVPRPSPRAWVPYVV